MDFKLKKVEVSKTVKPGPEGNLRLIVPKLSLKIGDDISQDLLVKDSQGIVHDLCTLSLSKNIVVFIYPGNYEGTQFGEPGMWGCTPEACSFKHKHKLFADIDVNVFGMSFQSKAVQEKFRMRQRLPFPILSDTKKIITTKIGIAVWQVVTGHDREGEEFPQRTTMILAEGNIKAIWRDIRIRQGKEHEDAAKHVAMVERLVSNIKTP